MWRTGWQNGTFSRGQGEGYFGLNVRPRGKQGVAKKQERREKKRVFCEDQGKNKKKALISGKFENSFRKEKKKSSGRNRPQILLGGRPEGKNA